MTGAAMIVIPGTGELVDLASLGRDQLVDLRVHIGDMEMHVAAAKRAVNDEIVGRIDRENAAAGSGYTWRTGGYKISVPSPTAGGRLHHDNLREDLIANHRELDIDALFRRKTTFELKIDAWRNLIKQRPELDELRRAHTAPTSRYPTVTAVPFAHRAIDTTAEDADG